MAWNVFAELVELNFTDSIDLQKLKLQTPHFDLDEEAEKIVLKSSWMMWLNEEMGHRKFVNDLYRLQKAGVTGTVSIRIPALHKEWLYMLEEDELEIHEGLTVYPGKSTLCVALHIEAGIVYDARLFPTSDEAWKYLQSTLSGMNAGLSEACQYKDFDDYNENSEGVLTVEEALIGYRKE